MTSILWSSDRGQEIIEKLKKKIADREISAFGIDLDGNPHVFSTGEAREVDPFFEDVPVIPEEAPGLSLFEGEARPGSGLVRSRRGDPFGPPGCIGVFLDSPRVRERSHLLTAGHLLSNGNVTSGSPVRVSRTADGTTGNGRRRTLGELSSFSPLMPATSGKWNQLDAALVVVDQDVATNADTSCFGAFAGGTTNTTGEFWKCGNVEPVFTEGIVYLYRFWFRIERNRQEYLFEEQILMKSSPEFTRPFAKPGDSGAAVVHSQSNEVLGMIIAGSVPRDLFVVTPFSALEKFWKAEDDLEFPGGILATRAALEPTASQPPVAFGSEGPGSRRRRLL